MNKTENNGKCWICGRTNEEVLKDAPVVYNLIESDESIENCNQPPINKIPICAICNHLIRMICYEIIDLEEEK